jgi:hypothetical protein
MLEYDFMRAAFVASITALSGLAHLLSLSARFRAR